MCPGEGKGLGLGGGAALWAAPELGDDVADKRDQRRDFKACTSPNMHRTHPTELWKAVAVFSLIWIPVYREEVTRSYLHPQHKSFWANQRVPPLPAQHSCQSPLILGARYHLVWEQCQAGEQPLRRTGKHTHTARWKIESRFQM